MDKFKESNINFYTSKDINVKYVNLKNRKKLKRIANKIARKNLKVIFNNYR